MNFEINVDYWLNCVECLQEDKNSFFRKKRFLDVGVEISTNSLIVHCFKHGQIIKLYKLANEEVELMPEECDQCNNVIGDE